MKHTKKFLALALVAISILVAAIPALATVPPKYYWVDVPNGQTVNVRDDNDNVIFTLPKGTRVLHLYTLSPCFRIKTDDGREGYIKMQYLSNTYVPPITGNPWDSRYGTTIWKMKDHGSTYYAQVANIQRDLRRIGYKTITKIDGYYGRSTMQAVKNFQRNNGLTEDGICGNNTKSKLWYHPDR